MKKFSLFAFAAAGLLLSACSDKDDVNIAQGPNFGDGASIGVSIQMPSAMNTTRANEDFEDGVASEYAVKDATLYIFKGESEAAATYVAEYQIGTSFEMDGGENVTSTMQEATQISNELAEEITKSDEAVNYYGVRDCVDYILNNQSLLLAKRAFSVETKIFEAENILISFITDIKEPDYTSDEYRETVKENIQEIRIEKDGIEKTIHILEGANKNHFCRYIVDNNYVIIYHDRRDQEGYRRARSQRHDTRDLTS